MAFVDELAKDNTKVIFIRLKYLEVDLAEKEIFFSDHDIDIPEDLLSGDLIKPEPRLQKIPNFSRLIDIMDNKAIIKSGYSFNIDNQDDEFTEFFQDNYFRNTKIDVFLTIKELDTFDYIQLSQGTIKEIKIDSKVKLKTDELTLFEKTLSTLNLFDYDNQDDDLNDKYKPTLSGKIDNYPATNISTGKDFFVTDITVDTSIFFTLNKFQVSSEANADKLRNYLKVGDTFKFEGFGQEYTLLNNQESDNNLTFQVDKQILVSGDYRIEVSEESILTNSKYYVSDNQSSKYLEATLASSLTAGDSEIFINEDWSFLEVGNIITILKTGEEHLAETFFVGGYTASTKRITIKGNQDGSTVIDTISRDMDTTYKVYFEKVQAVRNGRDVYTNKPSLTVLECGAASDINNSFDTRAELILLSEANSSNYIKYESSVVGETGNGPEIVYINDGILGSETLTRTLITNKYGSYYRWEVHIAISNSFPYLSTSLNTIKTLFDNWVLAPVPNFTTTIVGSIFTSQKITYDPQIIEGGTSNHPYLQMDVQLTEGSEPLKYAIWWLKPAFPSFPPTVIKDFDYILQVDVANGDTAADIRDKTITAINAENSTTFPFIASENSSLLTNVLNIKKTTLQENKINSRTNSTSVALNNFYASSIGGIEFYNTEIDGDNLILNIKQDNMVYRLKNILENVTIQGSSASNSLNKKRIQIQDSDRDKAGNVDFNDRLYIKSELLFEDPKLKLTNCTYTDDNFIYTNDELDYFTDKTAQLEVWSKIEIDDITIDYVDDVYHLSDVLELLFNIYNVTNYSATDLSDLKANHPDFYTFLKLDEDEALYKTLGDYLVSFNLFTFVDKEGVIRIKFHDPYAETTNTLDWFNKADLKYTIKEFTNTDIIYKILPDLGKDSFTNVDITDSFINSYKTATGLEDSKEIETKIMKNFLGDTYLGSLTYGDVFARKFFRKTKEVEVFGNLELLQYEIGDLLSIENFDEINPQEVYIITGIETNGTNTKLTLFTVLPKVKFNLIDENGNNVVDENDNQIVG